MEIAVFNAPMKQDPSVLRGSAFVRWWVNPTHEHVRAHMRICAVLGLFWRPAVVRISEMIALIAANAVIHATTSMVKYALWANVLLGKTKPKSYTLSQLIDEHNDCFPPEQVL